MNPPSFHNRIRKVGALVTATLILPALAISHLIQRILSISELLPVCELGASNASFQLLSNCNYPHKTAENPD
jgi:hypothetical protein